MSGLLHLSVTELEQHFGQHPFTFEHELVNHPLTHLDALAELADSLPVDVVEHNLGKVPDVVPGGHVPKAALTPGEMVRTIETNGCWMVLPIHFSRTYRQFYDALVDEVRSALPVREGKIVERQAVFFLASSGSTTPTHIDLEQGLLLHIRGEKEIRLGDFTDPQAGQLQIEKMHKGGHRNLPHEPQHPDVFQLRAGTGVHVPAFMPHVVHTSSQSIALSLTVALRTEATLRSSRVYRINTRLRSIGLNPRGPGKQALIDGAKSRLVDTADRLVARGRDRV